MLLVLGHEVDLGLKNLSVGSLVLFLVLDDGEIYGLLNNLILGETNSTFLFSNGLKHVLKFPQTDLLQLIASQKGARINLFHY